MSGPAVPSKSPYVNNTPLPLARDQQAVGGRTRSSQDGIVEDTKSKGKLSKGSRGVALEQVYSPDRGHYSHHQATHQTPRHHHPSPDHYAQSPPLQRDPRIVYPVQPAHLSPHTARHVHTHSDPAPTHPTPLDRAVTPEPASPRLSNKLLLAFKSKPTLSKTWEKKAFTEELRSAPLQPLNGGNGGNVDVRAPGERPTSLYASPSAMRSFRPLPQTAPSSPRA